MERIIFHIDVNNAFLSWTAVYLLRSGYHEDIRNIVSVIGGDESKRSGIVVAKSPMAKKYGIVTAETLYSARKKYPKLQVFKPNYSFYSEMSNKLFSFLKKITPDIEIASIDECYMDYGKIKSIYGDEVVFATKLKDKIYSLFGFTVNIGIANNKLCAKMASDFLKPNRVHTLYSYEVSSKMWPLPIEDLFMVGKSTSSKLRMIGINTIGDLANCDVYLLSKYFKNYNDLIRRANGIDDSLVDSSLFEAKGISNEITLPADIVNKADLYNYLSYLSEKVSLRIKSDGKYANVVCVILKDNLFKRRSHQVKVKNPIRDSSDIFAVSKRLLNEMWRDGDMVRLIGIRLDDLVCDYKYQMSLFDNNDRVDSEKIDKVLSDINKKLGYDAVKKCNMSIK